MGAGVHLFIAIIISSVICIISSLNLWEVIDLKAVSFSQGTLEYYHTVRVQKSGDPPEEVADQEGRANIKKKICRNVFTSHHFKMIGQDWMDVDDEKIRNELQNNSRYREIFESIFVDTSGMGDYEYENVYQKHPYHIEVYGDPLNEYVFACPVRNRQTREIKRYFVSQEYNVNASPLGDPIAGRFIFEIDENHRLQVRAIAEEAALRLTMSRISYLVDMEYLRARLHNRPTEILGRDPLCRLSDAHKIRLCASLFSASDFKGKITFLPVSNYVQGRCESVEVSVPSYTFLFFTFVLGFIRPSEAISLPFDSFKEWTLGCYALTNTGAQMVYYISKGNIRNSMYVYVESDDDDEDLLLYNHYYNVSVVGEVDDVETTDDEEGLSDTNQLSETDDEQREPGG